MRPSDELIFAWASAHLEEIATLRERLREAEFLLQENAHVDARIDAYFEKAATHETPEAKT